MNVIYDTMMINIIVGVISIAICLLGAVYVMIGASVDKELDRKNRFGKRMLERRFHLLLK